VELVNIIDKRIDSCTIVALAINHSSQLAVGLISCSAVCTRMCPTWCDNTKRFIRHIAWQPWSLFNSPPPNPLSGQMSKCE